MSERSGRIVARNFFALGAGEVAARIIAFGASVWMARVLGAGTYGIIGFTTAVILYMSRVVDFGIELSGARDLAKNPKQLDTLASSLLTIRLTIAAVLIASSVLIGLLLLPQPDGKALALYSFTLLAVGAGTRWIYIGLERATFVPITRAAGELTMALLVLTLVHGPADLLRAPIAQVAGDSLAAILLLVWLRRHGHTLRFRFDWANTRPLFQRAAPLMLSALLGLVVFNSGLLFLRLFKGSAAVGYFSAAYMLVSFLVNLGLAYRMSLLPTLARLEELSPARAELYHGAMAHVFVFALPVAFFGSLLAPSLLDFVFGAGYRPSVVPLQLLVWTVPLCVLRDVPSAVLLANAREDQFFRLTAAGAVVNLVFNLALIPKFGMVGAAVAALITESVRLLIALAYVRAHGFRLRDLTLFARASLATLGVSLVLFLSRSTGLWAMLAIAGLGYAGALLVLGAVRLRRGEFPAINV